MALSCAMILPPATAQAQQQAGREDFPAGYPVLHPQFRKWPSPSLDNEAASVSPTLLWPTVKKGTGYDIRLSQDSTFRTKQAIEEQRISWTMYNPHRKLNTGTWFWQYRLHDGNWSALQRFRITAASAKAIPPAVEKMWAAIPVSHPRVLIDKKNESTFRLLAKGTDDANTILSGAGAWLDTLPPDEKEGEEKMEGNTEAENNKIAMVASGNVSKKVYKVVDLFCKAYVLTGDPRYARQAIAWAMAVAGWDPEGVSYLNDFGDARCMVSMALVFDTFHDQLTSSQRNVLVKAIHTRADRFYHEWVNNIEAKVLSNHVWQYILHYFFQTAIALHGESGDARKWIEYAYELWLARAPVLGGGDGGWQEGASYFRLNMETLLGIPMIIKEYTGFDFISNNVWYRENPYWMLYSFPPASFSDGFGDDVEKIHSPGKDYLAYADALAKLTGSRVAAWYAGKISQTEKIKTSDADMLRWFRMRYLHDLKSPEAIDPATLPAAKAFRGTGVADIHSALPDRENDLMVSFRSSPYGSYGHLLADQNTFNVLYGGERLFYMSGHKLAMQDPHRLEWYKATRGHNGILIDGKGQPFNVEAYGYLPRFLNGKHISYVAGDASQAYASKAEKVQTGLTRFRRHLLFLHPNILVIYDELEADHPAQWSWLIHSPYKIGIDTANNQFRCSSDKVMATTSLLARQAMRWEIADTFAVPVVNWLGREDEDGNLIEYSNDQWHLTAQTVTKSRKIRFLAVMRISAKGEVVKDELAYTLNARNEMLVDNWLIRAELDAARPALLEAYNNDRHVSFTSGAEKIMLDNKVFAGKIKESSKVAEFIGGKYVYTEAGDILPDAVKEIPAKGRE